MADFDGVVSGDIYVLAAKSERLLPQLLPFLCMSDRFLEHAIGTSAGSLSPRTNWSSVAQFKLALPPLEQQRRIAEMLWAIDDVVQNWLATAHDMELAHNVRLTAMMLGTERRLRDIGDFVPPTGWSVRPAEELVATPITKGGTPSRHLNTNEATVPFIKVYNLTFSGALDFSVDPTYLEPRVHESDLKRSRVRPGDILMNIVGPPLGKTAVIPDGFPEANINQAIAIYRIHEDILRNFFAEYIRTELAQKWLEKRSKKTSGQRNLTLELAQSLPVPIPPADVMTDIVTRAASFSAAKQRIQAVLRDASNLRRCVTNQLSAM